MNIYEKMAKIAEEMPIVRKGIDIKAGKNSYKAVGERDVLATVKPLLAKYGVYAYPCRSEIVESGTIESTGYDGSAKKQMFLRVCRTMRFVNVEQPEEYIEVDGYGDGIDTGDKAPGKAVTYADKYCYLKAVGAETGDDPDKDASDETLNAARTSKPLVTPEQIAEFDRLGVNVPSMCAYFHVSSVEELTAAQAAFAINAKKEAAGKQ